MENSVIEEGMKSYRKGNPNNPYAKNDMNWMAWDSGYWTAANANLLKRFSNKNFQYEIHDDDALMDDWDYIIES